MDLYVQIPFGKIQNKQSINKIELTSINKYLTNEQKKRVAKFYREEAAKRTKHAIEPVWTIPNSVELVVKADRSKPLPAPAQTDLKPTETKSESIPVTEVVPIPEDTPEIE